jgi:hypothetical protein
MEMEHNYYYQYDNELGDDYYYYYQYDNSSIMNPALVFVAESIVELAKSDRLSKSLFYKHVEINLHQDLL